MTGVYGDFIEVFPELFEPCDVWNNADGSDVSHIRAIYMPNKGGGLKRRKYTSGNTAQDVIEEDDFYVEDKYSNICREGTYVRRKRSPQWIMRLTNDLGFDVAAGYHVFKIESVTGATIDKQEGLQVKEGRFA